MVRIYAPEIHVSDLSEILLEGNGAHHLLNVLRCREGDAIVIFDGREGEYHTVVAKKEKKRLWLTLIEKKDIQRESPLSIHLIQAISKGDRMDFVVQKAVELGVTRITPVLTQHGAVKLDADRMIKKMEHWHNIAISACEQCGRNKIPNIDPIMTWSDWMMQTQQNIKPAIQWILHPGDDAHTLRNVNDISIKDASLCIGPEGGFSEIEVKAACVAGYTQVTLGPRILRTETAAIAGITVLQSLFGDF